MHTGAFIEHNTGTGKTLILLYEQSARFQTIALETTKILDKNFKTILIAVPKFNESDWQIFADSLAEVILEAKLKNFCLVCFGSAAALAMHFYLSTPKLVRSLVLVDASTRPHPSKYTRFIDRLEAYFPMGLPFRSFGEHFNGKPFLQRMRCPCLIVTTSQASTHHLEEAIVLQQTLPTAWTASAEWNNLARQLKQLILDFQSVAAKRPQKNL